MNNQKEILLEKNNWLLVRITNSSYLKIPSYLFVENKKTGFCDHPVFHEHTREVVYDYPEKIPSYFKKTVHDYLNLLHDYSKYMENKNESI